jgi:hypothetical protein
MYEYKEVLELAVELCEAIKVFRDNKLINHYLIKEILGEKLD